MKKIWKWTFVAFAVCCLSLTAIAQTAGLDKKSEPETKKVDNSQSSEGLMTVAQILAPFLLRAGSPDTDVSWNDLNKLTGIKWEDEAPVQSSFPALQSAYYRSGTTTLVGRGNARVSFAGSKTVASKAHIIFGGLSGPAKLFGFDDYSKVLLDQFGTKASIKLLSGGKCPTTSGYASAEYEIILEERKPIYVLVESFSSNIPDTNQSSFDITRKRDDTGVCHSSEIYEPFELPHDFASGFPAVPSKGGIKKKNTPQPERVTAPLTLDDRMGVEQIAALLLVPAGSPDTEILWKDLDKLKGLIWDEEEPTKLAEGLYSRSYSDFSGGRGMMSVSFLGNETSVTGMRLYILDVEPLPGYKTEPINTFKPSEFAKIVRDEFGPKALIKPLRGKCPYEPVGTYSAAYLVTPQGKKPINVLLDTSPLSKGNPRKQSTFRILRGTDNDWKCTPDPPKAKAAQDAKAIESSNTAIMTVEQIIAPFLLPTGSPDKEIGWKTLDTLKGVNWYEKGPAKYIPDNPEYSRIGTIQLVGRGNSSASFTGTEKSVLGVRIDPEIIFGFDDYSKVLSEQLGSTASIKFLGGTCLNGPGYYSAAYEIVLKGKQPIYVLLRTDQTNRDPNRHDSSFKISRRLDPSWVCRSVTVEEIAAPLLLPAAGPDTEIGWSSLDKLTGIFWNEPAPHKYPSGNYRRHGIAKLVERGGVDFLFTGSETSVSSVEIARGGIMFGVDEFLNVLREQFGSKASIKLLRGECPDELPGHASGYQIIVEGKKPIYVMLRTDQTSVGYSSFIVSRQTDDDWKCKSN